MAGRSRTTAVADDDEAFLAAHTLSPEEAWAMFDAEAREWLNMSGEEFLRKWDADEFDVDGPDHTRIIHIYFLIPFVRQD